MIFPPKKSLGQNFLTCPWVGEAMLQSAELNLGDTVLEIGPGRGALTHALAATGAHIIAIEKDEALAATLAEELEGKNACVKIIADDILTWFPRAQKNGTLPAGYKVVAAIPYYLTARLIRVLLQREPRPERIIITIPHAVAKRIVAIPPHMNLLALAVQVYGVPRIIKTVPATCFDPPPKIESAILEISGISDDFFQKERITQEDFFALVRIAFSQKRKTLVNSLGTMYTKKLIEQALDTRNLPRNTRPQELSRECWVCLVRTLASMSVIPSPDSVGARNPDNY
ncbi:MAG: 16S rRNA (adenine(1518)-N(6)/adenine(1519)-N(6))-dimethyltransferase RsmA [bacterium]|nr:16S rRNA (adenine(1518)-N(6)/adenine(1519)-N(6))-dimethyltransferase RsmA [bacterium]